MSESTDTAETLAELVQDLINQKSEGGFWDFKEQWHANKADLLHDIICMANNIENRDGLIIIGVEDKWFRICGVEDTDPNRKNSADLTDFLRGKHFQGEERPIISVTSIELEGKELDVITIKNSSMTPFVLTEPYKDLNKSVAKNQVYTRIGDTNTPIDKTADLDKIQYLWRKRFGLDLTTLEKLGVYLDAPDDWVYDDESGTFYYTYAPEFVIEIESEYFSGDYRERSEFWNKQFPDSSGFHWEDFIVKYHQTIIYKGICSYLDGGRYLVVVPERTLIRSRDNNWLSDEYFQVFYYDLSEISGKLNRLFILLYKGDYSWHSNGPLAESVVIFENSSEKNQFLEFLIDTYDEIGDIDTCRDVRRKTESKDGDERLAAFEDWEYQTMRKVNEIFRDWKTE